jgi:4-amino-4-deoxy-L-arabinose transferase-like glycosyltransferase
MIAHAAVGAGTVICGALLAAELFGPSVAVIAALLLAIYPYFVMHDVRLQETGLFTFLTTLAMLLLVRARHGSLRIAGTAGLVFGLDLLTRPTILPFLALAPFLIAFQASNLRTRMRAAAAFTLPLVVVALPWLIRSVILVGSPTFTSEGGNQLWSGNNAYTFSRYPHESIDLSVQQALQHLSRQEQAELASCSNEALVDDWYRRKAIAYMREDPWRTFRNGLRKLAAAFSVWPNPAGSAARTLMHLLSYGPMLALGVIGAFLSRRSWRDHLPIYALFLSFAFVAFTFFAHTNHRTFLDVYLIIFAASTLVRLQKALAQ